MIKESSIYSTWLDRLFILWPPFFCLLIVFLFPSLFQLNKTVNDWQWMVWIVLLDVGHVYSTLIRLYFDKDFVRTNKVLLIVVPLLSFFVGVLIYGIGSGLFWTLLAYLAVFHFVRQQYGFMRIYSPEDGGSKWGLWIDKVTIYSACIYPLVHWHLSGNKMFNWFVDDDFVFYVSPSLDLFFRFVYFGVLAIYLLKEIRHFVQTKFFYLSKQLVLFGTVLSWYFSIVYFNSDLIFSFLNVVCHGLPYFGIVLFFALKKIKKNATEKNRKGPVLILFFAFVLVFLIAYVEEGFWDALVWRDHPVFFSGWYQFLEEGKSEVFVFLIPLLTVPQIAHYVLDAYLWKVKKNKEIAVCLPE